MHLTVQQLSASLDGVLTGPSLELVVRHLAACHDCRDRQARLAKHDDALRRLLAQDPEDVFLDDLTRRSEALVIAISRGLPQPVMLTSVPLLHEEDPYAPTEPPPPPARPELGRAGEMAKEAGYGRIGAKPVASTQAPQSDPAEAQRMLEALASGGDGDFTELTAEGMRDHAPIDGPTFDLPEWITAQSRKTPAERGPREVQKLNLFFEELGEQLANLPPDAVHEVFRREDDPANEPGMGSSAPLPPESHEPASAAPGPAGGDSRPYASPAWAGAGFEPALPGLGRQPGSGSPAPDSHLVDDAPAAPRVRHRRRHDGAMVLALASLTGLLAVVLALQFFPANPSRPGSPASLAGRIQLPRVEFVRHDSAEAAPAPVAPDVRTASTQPPLEQVLPPLAPADPEDDTTPATSTAPPPAAPEPVASAPAKPARMPAAATPKRKPSATLASSPIGGAVAAQPVEESDWPLVCGLVEDADGNPLPGARVSVAELSFAIRTDARGRFCLSAPPGAHTLLIEAQGMPSRREPATFATGTTDLHIRLRATH